MRHWVPHRQLFRRAVCALLSAGTCAVILGGGKWSGHSSSAEARPMDPSLSRLVADPQCRADRSRWPCRPNQAQFQRLMNQWGAVLAPSGRGGARTLGVQQMELSVSATATDISSNADYWTLGSEGSTPQAERNSNPSPFLTKLSGRVHRGLGFGLQISGSLGIIAQSNAVVWGLDIRQGLFEGLKQLAPAYLPDISVGLGVRKVTGFGEVSLFTQAADLRFARTYVAGASHSISPWLGLQWMRIVGETELVDLTPGIDAVAECGNRADSTGSGTKSSGCPGSGADRENTTRFEATQILRHRLQMGVDYRHDSLTFGMLLATDILDPAAAQWDSGVAKALRCTDSDGACFAAVRQWALDVELGIVF